MARCATHSMMSFGRSLEVAIAGKDGGTEQRVIEAVRSPLTLAITD